MGAVTSKSGGACVAVAFILMAMLVFVPGASADLRFCPPGPGAGQCEKQAGVAVDTATGQVFVADRGNARIDVFKADGTFLFAFGWGVKDGTEALQSCTAATTCMKGIVGSGAGQLNGARKIAVDSSSHALYVFDGSNLRVQKFDAEGHFLRAWGWDVVASGPDDDASPPIDQFEVCVQGVDICKAGTQGGGNGQFGREEALIALGPGGTVYVGDTQGKESEGFNPRIETFEPTGAFLEAVPLTHKDFLSAGFAVNSSGDVYAAFGKDDGIFKFHPDGTEFGAPYPLEPVGTAVTAVAVDSADNLFVAHAESKARSVGAWRILTEYSPGGTRLRRFGYGSIERNVLGLALFASAAGDVFAGEEENGVDYLSFPPPGPVVVPPSVLADPVGSTKATLGAEANPEGKPTSYRFEFVEEATYLKDVEELGEDHGFDHATGTDPAPLPIGPGDPGEFKLHPAEAQIGCSNPVQEASEEGKCLTPETDYRFRIVVENADGKGNSPLEGRFTTKGPLEFGNLWSTAVGTDTALVHGEVNPLGIPTTGWFEYVDDSTYLKDVEELGKGHGFDHASRVPDVAGGEDPIDFGAGEELTARSASLFPLSPGTVYHYRLVAQDPLVEPIVGPERTLRTLGVKEHEDCSGNEGFRTGPSAQLPDCRAYELVSPLDKSGGDIIVLGEFSTNLPAVLNQSSTTGAKLAYGSYRSFGGAQSAPFTTQYIARRDGERSEWVSHAISPPLGKPIFGGALAAADTEFKAFSPDLCEGWLRTIFDPPLAAGGIQGYPNLYRRTDEECGGPSYEALTNAGWPSLDPGEEQAAKLELQGLSADGSHAIYIAPDSLEGSGAPPQPPQCVAEGEACRTQLYVWAGGPSPVFACVLPNGKALQEACSAGTTAALVAGGKSRSANLQGAISADGSRVFWTDSGTGEGKVYVREHPEQGHVAGECSQAAKACTIAVSKDAEALSGTSKSRFWAASADGSKAIFGSGEDLYEFDVDAATTTLIAHHALPGGSESGVLGVSEDASHVYFASTDAMGGPNSEGQTAAAGKPNLYLYRAAGGGSYAFIATLSSLDLLSVSPPRSLSPIAREPLAHLARVSGDGLRAAFVSSGALTGYDNTDAGNGGADAEVFLFDATANGGVGKLLCVSCNPSGARPVGANIKKQGAQFWAAGQIPVPQNDLYGARVLSADGRRLFFESSDALAPGDTNGVQDVYEWEAAGRGGCKAELASFSPQAGGCVELISSGQSAKGSEFIEASPSGDDVFFATLSSLVPQDYGLIDIYDARVGGGLPPPPAPPEPCEGEACQSPPAPPQAPTPATATFGRPDQTLPGESRCAKGRRRVVRKGKPRCVPAHRKRHGHRRSRK